MIFLGRGEWSYNADMDQNQVVLFVAAFGPIGFLLDGRENIVVLQHHVCNSNVETKSRHACISDGALKLMLLAMLYISSSREGTLF